MQASEKNDASESEFSFMVYDANEKNEWTNERMAMDGRMKKWLWRFVDAHSPRGWVCNAHSPRGWSLLRSMFFLTSWWRGFREFPNMDGWTGVQIFCLSRVSRLMETKRSMHSLFRAMPGCTLVPQPISSGPPSLLLLVSGLRESLGHYICRWLTTISTADIKPTAHNITSIGEV